jgi:hypothetical protein
MTHSHNAKEVFQELNNESKEREEYFTPEAMIIAVADKKRRRARKGLEFNCIVLDRAATNGDELVNLLMLLEREKSRISNNTRFQIVCRTKEGSRNHWTAMDVMVKDGELQFYLLDAANSLPSVLSAISVIHANCPNAVIRYSGGQMQADGHNCATFSLDHVFRMAKMPHLHEQLSKMEHTGALGKHSNYSEYMANMLAKHPEIANGRPVGEVLSALRYLKYVSVDSFTSDFGPLLRNMQNYETLEEKFFPKNMQGNDRVDLKTYVDARTEHHQRSMYSPSEPRNNGIVKKRKKIKSKAALYLKDLDEKDFKSAIEKNSDYKSFWQKRAASSQTAETLAKEDLSLTMHEAKSELDEIKLKIETTNWQTGVFGGEKLFKNKPKVPAGVKAIYDELAKKNDSRTDLERLTAVKGLITASHKKTGHGCLNQRSQTTSDFYDTWHKRLNEFVSRVEKELKHGAPSAAPSLSKYR